LESDKLASKTGRLHRILALREPDDRYILHVDIPVYDRRVITFLAWLASTKHKATTG
jgi:hypothetical protein